MSDVISGTIKVTSAGTKVAAAHKGNVSTVSFKARTDNTGDMFVGGSDVSSTDGMTLTPGEAITIRTKNAISTSQYFADAINSNDQVDFIGSI